MENSIIELGDARLHLRLERDQNRLLVHLFEATRGRQWGPVALCQAQIYDKSQFRLDTLTEFRVDSVEKIADAVHIVLGDTARRVQFAFWLRVEDGELVFALSPAEMYESKNAVYRLFNLKILPGLMQTCGEFLLPLNTGCLCRVSDKPALHDKFLLYGEQPRWELMPLMPLAASFDAQGGWLALATQGAEETELHVLTDGMGAGELAMGFGFRQSWPDKVEIARREVRFAPLRAGEDVLHFAARRLRRHVVDDWKKPTLLERAQESPQVASFLKSYTMKLFFGVENEGIMMDKAPKEGHLTFKQTMSFAEAAQRLRWVKEAGIERVVTQMVGWNPRGHDGLWPTRFPIEERLGGESGLRALIETGRSLGFEMNVHDNYLSAYKNSPDFDADLVIWDEWGEPMGLGEWGGGITFVQWALTLPEEKLRGEMERLKALGLNGMAYLDGMANPLYHNYHPKNRGTRSDYARGINRIMRVCREVWGAAHTECGFLYALPFSDGFCSSGARWQWESCREEWPVTALLERRVPLWQLAMQGLVFRENQGHDWKSTMRCVLMGEHPRIEWAAHPGVMPVLTGEMLDALKARYDLCLTRFGFLQTTALERWEEIEPGLEETHWADGTRVRADWNREVLVVNGETIARH